MTKLKTPEEIARELVVHHEREWSYVNKGQHLRAAIAQAIRERDAQVKEACAQIAEEHVCGCGDHGTEPGRLIRTLDLSGGKDGEK